MWSRDRRPFTTVVLALALAAVVACERDTARRPSPEGSSSPEPSARFTRHGADLGLEFQHESGARGEYFLPEIMGSGCALLDYDRDGDLDVYALQGRVLARKGDNAMASSATGDRLFRNQLVEEGAGNLRFVDVTSEAGLGEGGARGRSSYGMGCAVGDVDDDGDPDLYLTRFGDDVLYRNRGDGTFENITRTSGVRAPGFTTSAAFLDYDRDGDLDLFVCTYVEYSVETNRDCFRLGGERDYCGPASYSPLPDRLFRNEGEGRFVDVSIEAGIASRAAYGLGVICADLDGDGWVDIAVANDATPNHLWLNRHDGTFEERGLVHGFALNASGGTEAGMGIAAADFDDDGDVDLFLTHEVDETNTLYRNLGAARFEDASGALRLGAPSVPYSGFGVAWLDFDRDSRLDLFVANGAVRKIAAQLGESRPFHQPDLLFRSAGGRFEAAGFAPHPTAPERIGRGVASGDIDNDGDVDLLVANNAGPLELFLDESPPAETWLSLRLESTRSARDAYDARVTLQLEGGRALYRRVATDGSYLSASDPRVHVALPPGEALRSIEVRWPAGGRERFGGVSPNRETLLREGDGEAAE